jgi:hypothetical protein
MTESGIDRHVPRLTDNLGNRYKRITFGLGTTVVGRVNQESIHPGKTVDDVLVFEEPLANADVLRLGLPASAFGGTGEIKFEIPKSMIRRP